MPRREGGPRTSINHIVVSGYEKKKQPSKHYVFVIDIIWDNDERYEVLRRYSEFFTLNDTLQLVFSKSSEPNLTIPVLPKRKFFGRSHVEKVAEARVESINKYCQGLIRLNSKISQSKHVLAFFSPKIGDRSLPKLRLQRPASLYPQIRPAGNTVWEEHCVIASFIGDGVNQMSADSGDQVRVLNKDDSGWWLVEKRGKVGWIPESYLKKCTNMLQDEDIGNFLGLIDAETKANDNGSDSRESSPGIELEAQDYKAIDSYTANEPGQLSFEQDDIITVLDKMEDGWWFVAKGKKEGWVPCGYLEPVSAHVQDEEEQVSESAATDLDKTEKYITMASYTAEENDEISFPAGVVIMVIYKSLTGWWMIKYDGKSGLAPATYMKKIEDEEQVVASSELKMADSNKEPVIGLQKSFKQSPRQHTVRKKRTSKGFNVAGLTQQSIEEVKEVESPKVKSRQRNSSDPKIKPEVTPRRKMSNPSDKSSPSVTTSLPNTSSMSSLGVNTPPRPRQTLIKRVYSSPKEEEDEFEDRRTARRNLSPSRTNGRRSPSPVRRFNSSPKPSRAFKGSNEEFNNNNGSGKEMSNGVGDSNPYTQQTAELLVKFVLASNDPQLKSELVKIVSSDPEILKALKN